ncbi:MAG TPA: LuxR C-terminal-related transcriptional regulator, partial [Chloroflexota bacterium]
HVPAAIAGQLAVDSLPPSSPALADAQFHAPEPRPERVARPRLLTMLHQSLQYRVVLLVAPAGYGKTTLLVDWLASQHPAAAWLTLDRGDNDPVRFYAAMFAALALLYPSISEGARPIPSLPEITSFDSMVTTLLNRVSSGAAIARSEEPAYLILDDFHHIRSRAITEGMARFLERLPPQLKLVIASRMRPALPLARLRVNREILEIGTADLAFTEDEVQQFTSTIMGLPASQVDVAPLTARLGGWPAALQLLCLSIEGASNPAESVARFTGSNRHVMDYLIEQVLLQQPPDVQTFLLHTCVLDRMSAPLCEALLESPNIGADDHADDSSFVLRRRAAQARLEDLEASNFFVTSVDQEGQWFCYHQLFADALRHRLYLDHPDLAVTLHGRASIWYEHNADMSQALHHAALGQDWERVAELLESMPRPADGTREYAEWMGGVSSMSRSVLRQHPNLAMEYIVDLWLKSRLEEARLALGDLEELSTDEPDQALREVGGSTGDPLPGRVQALRTMIAGMAVEEPDEVGALAHRALQRLVSDDHFYRAAVHYSWGVALRHCDRLRDALPRLSEAMILSEKAERVHLYLRCLDAYAHVLVDTGDMIAAAGVIELARSASPSLSEGAALLQGTEYTAAHIAFQRDDLDEARAHSLVAIQFARDCETRIWEIQGRILLSDVYRAGGEMTHALEELGVANDLVRDTMGHTQGRDRRLRRAISARLAWVAIENGEPGAAARWCATYVTLDTDPVPLSSWISRPVLSVTVRALVLDGRHDQARAMLAAQIARAAACGAEEARLGLLVLSAVELEAAGDHEAALDDLAAALQLAAPQENRRFFLDERKPKNELLHAVLKRKSLDPATRAFTRDLLTRLSPRTALMQLDTAHPELVEPLSEREQDILGLVARGLSNQEIADHVVLELSTVKWYITSIHGKLGVERRTQAVARGRELGFLP